MIVYFLSFPLQEFVGNDNFVYERVCNGVIQTMEIKERHERTLRYLLQLLRALSRSQSGDAVQEEILAKYQPENERIQEVER